MSGGEVGFDAMRRWAPAITLASLLATACAHSAAASDVSATHAYIAANYAVAKACVALFSDLFPATTGQVLYVDGGFSAIGV